MLVYAGRAVYQDFNFMYLYFGTVEKLFKLHISISLATACLTGEEI